jgi:FkbM family methyltransferase
LAVSPQALSQDSLKSKSLMKHKLLKLKRLFVNSHQIGEYSIRVPSGYSLEVFQTKNPLYDRFLPCLAKQIDIADFIVDVGANVGDSLFAMYQVRPSIYICIEPSTVFLKYLNHNIEQINQKKDILVYSELISSKPVKGEFEYTHKGTARIKEGGSQNNIPSSTLDNLIGDKKIALIKSDTDGYDYDVLLSSKKIIEEQLPILFFECDPNDQAQFRGFVELFLYLANKYVFYFFDNFGNLLLENAPLDNALSLLNYLKNIKSGSATLTLHYFDVLAINSEKHQVITQSALRLYKTEYNLHEDV